MDSAWLKDNLTSESFISGMSSHTFLGTWEDFSIDYIMVTIHMMSSSDNKGYVLML